MFLTVRTIDVGCIKFVSKTLKRKIYLRLIDRLGIFMQNFLDDKWKISPNVYNMKKYIKYPKNIAFYKTRYMRQLSVFFLTAFSKVWICITNLQRSNQSNQALYSKFQLSIIKLLAGYCDKFLSFFTFFNCFTEQFINPLKDWSKKLLGE